MAIPAFLAPVFAFMLREVIVKFLVMAVIFVAITELMPLVIGYLGNFINPGGLSSAFSAIPAGVWFFWDVFQFDVGVPLVISAYVARFSIRRLPFVG